MLLRPSGQPLSSSLSGHGCRECQHRQIQCGPEQPGGRQCLHGSMASMSTPWSSASRPPSFISTAATDPQPTLGIDPMNHPLAHLAPSGELNIPELELMIQWCTETYRSVSRNPAVEWIWHAAVPREAMHQPFLMHGILALSALHLAFTSAGAIQTAHLHTAYTHQRHAHAGLAKAVRSLDASNCNAAFAVSSLLTVFSFAVPLVVSPPSGLAPLDELCLIFQRTQRSTPALAEIIDWVSRSELRPLVECNASRPRMPDTSRLAVMALLRINVTLATQSTRHEKDVFERTIESLGRSLDRLARGGELMVTAFEWIFQIPPRFIDLLRARHPFSLVILAHYAVIIHSLRRHWWVGDWGERVIQAVGRHLDAEWRPSISWVLDATGCYIPG